MHALELLTRQHREVFDLFEQLRAVTGLGVRVRLLGRLAEALTLHSELEERHFYPLLAANGLPDGASQARREHEAVRDMVSRLMELKQRSPEIDMVLARLETAVREHLGWEEEELFVWVRGRVSEEALRTCGESMVRTESQLAEGSLLTAERQEPPPGSA